MEHVIRSAYARLKNPVDNRKAPVSGKWLWSQKGPNSGRLRFIYYSIRVLFFVL